MKSTTLLQDTAPKKVAEKDEDQNDVKEKESFTTLASLKGMHILYMHPKLPFLSNVVKIFKQKMKAHQVFMTQIATHSRSF
jgi:hypothetical protein